MGFETTTDILRVRYPMLVYAAFMYAYFIILKPSIYVG